MLKLTTKCVRFKVTRPIEFVVHLSTAGPGGKVTWFIDAPKDAVLAYHAPLPEAARIRKPSWS